MKLPPMIMQWDGEALKPTRRFQKIADQRLVIGEVYRVDPEEERSIASHNHYFAAITEAWRNLPEDTGERYPTSEHLRKWALIKSGYRDERSIVCATKAEAMRVAAFVRPLDEYAVVIVSETVVLVYTAKSQSSRAMGREAFQVSKDAVINLLASLLNTTPKQLTDAATHSDT
jgi:hypothetical protein